METREITCIVCPNGCRLKARIEDDEVVDVTGNACMKGYIYAQNEVLNPVRMVTSTVAVRGGTAPRASVKTEREVPKDKVMECMDALKGVCVKAPVSIGDTVVENIAQTGVDMVATVNVPENPSFL